MSYKGHLSLSFNHSLRMIISVATKRLAFSSTASSIWTKSPMLTFELQPPTKQHPLSIFKLNANICPSSVKSIHFIRFARSAVNYYYLTVFRTKGLECFISFTLTAVCWLISADSRTTDIPCHAAPASGRRSRRPENGRR